MNEISKRVANFIFNYMHDDALNMFKDNQADEFLHFGKNTEYTTFDKYFEYDKIKSNVETIVQEKYDNFENTNKKTITKMNYKEKYDLFYKSLNVKAIMNQVLENVA